jgi:hypothetical protein
MRVSSDACQRPDSRDASTYSLANLQFTRRRRSACGSRAVIGWLRLGCAIMRAPIRLTPGGSSGLRTHHASRPLIIEPREARPTSPPLHPRARDRGVADAWAADVGGQGVDGERRLDAGLHFDGCAVAWPQQRSWPTEQAAGTSLRVVQLGIVGRCAAEAAVADGSARGIGSANNVPPRVAAAPAGRLHAAAVSGATVFLN